MPQLLEEEAPASASPSPTLPPQDTVDNMRIRLTIQRNRLEPVDVLWTIPADAYKSNTHTISKWLSEIDEIFPLEADDWGFEDYVVHIQGFEALHFVKTGNVFRDGDHVTICPLDSADVRSRQKCGRHQISSNGVSLIDGVPFGRGPSRAIHRPEIQIPPRKRRRLTYDGAGTGAGGVDDSISLSDIDTSSERLALVNSGETSLQSTAKGGALKIKSKANKSKNKDDESKDKPKKVVRFGFLPKEDSNSDDEEDSDFDPDAVDGESLGDSEEEELSDTDTSTSEEADSSSDNDSDSDGPKSGNAKKANGTTKPAHDKSGRTNGSRSTDSEPPKMSNKRKNDETSDLQMTNKHQYQQTPQQWHVAPGQGMRKTRGRNVRRRMAKKLQAFIKSGVLPPTATKHDLEALYENSNEMLDDEGNEEVDTEIDEKEDHAREKSGAAEGVTEVGVVQSLAEEHQQTLDDAAELEARRKRLLDRLDSMEKVEHGELAGNMELLDGTETPPAHETHPEDADEEDSAKQPPAKRQRRDVEAANRMIFSSLGVRTPKTEEDREKIRQKLTNPKNHGITGLGQAAQEMKAAMIKSSADDDSWKEKISLAAVECCFPGVVLSTPPFPFIQRWDPQQQAMKQSSWARQQGKKRKRKGREEYGYGYQEQEAYEEEYGEQETYGGEYEGADQSTTLLNYDEETGELDSSMLQGQIEDQIMNDIATANDLPALPKNPDELKPATIEDLVPGAVVAYKVLEVSAATKWCPAILEYKTAIVLEDQGIGLPVFKVELAVRDRVQAKYDARGKRVFEKFEAIMDEDEVDDGVRELNFEELIEPKVVRAADGEKESDGENGIEGAEMAA